MSDRIEGLGRRTFLKLAGAAGAAAGCSPRAAVQKVVPYLVPPEDIIPGTPLFYRTVCRECAAGCGVTARTREGRAVKLEGNPEDPIGRGALCARGQAALQALYHPERFQGPLRRGADGRLAPIAWDDAEAAAAAAIAGAAASGPGAVRMLGRAEPGSLGALQKQVLAALGARPEHRVVLEPFDPAPLRSAGAALFGRAELPVFDLAKARSVVAFGADFLETWLSPVELARGFSAGRGRVGEERIRLTWVGPRLSLTGVSADRWIRVRPGGELAAALGLLRWLTDPASRVPGLGREAGEIFAAARALRPEELAAAAGVPWDELAALGRELARRRPSALLGPGPASQGAGATQLAAVIQLANLVLGNLGQTVLYGLDAREDVPSTFAEVEALLEAARAGQVKVLLLHHADPVGQLPGTARVRAALEHVPLIVSFASRPDGTTDLAHLVLPDSHWLESFGDVVVRRGVVNTGQPVMTPLWDTRPAGQVLLEIAAKVPVDQARLPATDLDEFLRSRQAAYAGAPPAAAPDPAALRQALQRGGWWAAPGPAPAPALLPGRAAGFLGAPPAPASGLALAPFPTALRGDGRGADLPWMREVPDALSSISWTAWAELSPATAAKLDVRTGDILGLSSAAGATELPAYVYPGIRDGSVGLPLGGPEVLALLGAVREPASGALCFLQGPVEANRARRGARLPLLEGSPYQHGREIVPVVTASAPALRHPDLSARMYAEPQHPEHRWAMAVDLDRCTGCQACVVACFAENNVPVMGPEAAEKGRYMGWIRVERYLGDEQGGPLDVRLLLLMCQHCTNAPCEPVCPVYATYHTREGLNAQVYNRCVGTRYCSNNCPYKVRTFNWRDAQFRKPLQMQLNPDVTVRSRGVMEKCTFCVQRIRYAENQATLEHRPLADGEIVPACAQTCPTQAIVFGDAKDPGSRVRRLAREPRAFRALEETNSQPAVTYLARVAEGGEP